MGQRIVIYLRVSTDEQGKSGLGLEAQEAAARRYVTEAGGEIIAVYTEVETGSNDFRPELLKALDHCEAARATLVIAKLDRLGRKVAFLATLMDSGVKFVCCDNPHANRFNLHIMAAMAEQEKAYISQRTKDSLHALKARGVPLGANRPGSYRFKAEEARKGSERGLIVRRARADNEARKRGAEALKLRNNGATLQGIAERFNARGYLTPRGKPWTATQIMRLIQRAEKVIGGN